MPPTLAVGAQRLSATRGLLGPAGGSDPIPPVRFFVIPRHPWRVKKFRIDKVLLGASMAIAFGVVVVAYGFSNGVTGGGERNFPEAVESVTPVPNAVQVLAQSNVIVDLKSGFTGILVINGVELETVNLDEIGSLTVEPGQQIDLPPVTVFEPGNATLTFLPRRGASIERFSTGVQEVTVIYWPIIEGPQRADRYSWTFNVL